MMMYYLGEFLLYSSFALLTGVHILILVPENKKPLLTPSKRWVQLAILLIVIASGMPVIQTTLFLQDAVGFIATFQQVLREFEVGIAWSNIVLLSLIYYILVSISTPAVRQHRGYAVVTLFFTLGMIGAVSSAGHSASLEGELGTWMHFSHLTFVSIWAGILGVVAWFATSEDHWPSFLRWFTPLAVGCLLAIIGSGLWMMNLTTDLQAYPSTWMLTYGQALVIKHLLVLPILVIAGFQAFYMTSPRHRVKKRRSLGGAKAESVLILLVFAATSTLSQSSPPHDISETMKSAGTSPWFNYFYGAAPSGFSPIEWQGHPVYSLFFVVALVFFILLIKTVKQQQWGWTIGMALCFVGSAYLGLMTNFY